MTKLHIYLGVAVLATNGLTALWGAIADAFDSRLPTIVFDVSAATSVESTAAEGFALASKAAELAGVTVVIASGPTT